MRVYRCCNFSGVNVIKKEDEDNLIYRHLTIGIQHMLDVCCKNKSDTSNSRGNCKILKISQTVPEKHSGKARDQ